MSPEQARAAARDSFGSVAQATEESYESRGVALIDDFVQDVRYGLRQLRKSPGFTLSPSLRLRWASAPTLPSSRCLTRFCCARCRSRSPSELLLFGDGNASGSTMSVPDGSWRLFSDSFFHDFRQKDSSFSGIAAVDSTQFATKGSIAGAAYQTTHVDLVSGSYFSVLGVPAFLGRTISESDDSADGAGPVAVASYSWFQRQFGGDPSALGKTIRIESHDYTLVGVARPGFYGFTVGQSTDLWIPLSMEKAFSRPGYNGLGNQLFQSLYLIGRLKPGVTAAQASAETNLLFKQIVRSYLGPQPSQKHLDDLAHASVELTPGGRGVSYLRIAFSVPLKILMAIVALVLLIACANIANMLLARGVARTREVAVRMALGASRRRIVFQLLTESVLLALLGAAAGVALAWKASVVLLSMATPGPDPVPLNLTPDMAVLGFTLGLRCSRRFSSARCRHSGQRALSSRLRSKMGAAVHPRRRAAPWPDRSSSGKLRFPLYCSLSPGSSCTASFTCTDVDTGFDKHNVLVFSLDSSTANLPRGTPDEIRSVRLQEQIEGRVQAIPGVQSDSFSFFTFNQGAWTDEVLFQGIPRTPKNGEEVFFNITGNGFFSTMGIPLIAGRTFNAQDMQNSPKVAVINETMARRFFPNGSAIGQRFGIGETPDHPGEFEVIGVVKDAKFTALDEGTLMAAYLPCTQSPGFFGNFAVRYAPGANRQEIVSRTRRAIAEINSNILVNSVGSLEEQVDDSIATQSLIARLSSFFGILAVFLACIGIYGLLSYSVARRTSELGIRLALGAQSHTLLWMILRESILLLALGLAAGIPVALSSTRLLKSLLFELSPLDPMAISIAIAAVAVMTIAAAWLPARRATKINPTQALRAE